LSIALLNTILRGDFIAFVKKCFNSLESQTKYIHNWHINLISEYLMDCTSGKIKRLDVNIPPRFLKSFIMSICYPMWVMGNNPTKKLACISYSASLSIKMSNDCRSIANQSWYKQCFPLFSLDSKENTSATMDTQKEFVTTLGGGRLATSVGGSITGRGFDEIIMDDVMNPKEAMSETIRTSTIEWIKSTVFSRLNNKKTGIIINIQQRLHEFDVSGSLCKDWVHLSIPAYFEENTIYKYNNFLKEVQSGDFLNPTLYDRKVMENDISEMGKTSFSCQYMQSPAPADGNIFKSHYWKFYSNFNREYDKIFLSIDTASTKNDKNDPSAIQVWGVLEGNNYLINNYKVFLEFPELKRKILSINEIYKPSIILIEAKANGLSLCQDLREIDKRLNIVEIKIPPGFDKFYRASTCIDLIEGGRVFLPEKSSNAWIEDYLYEFKMFPNGTYKDQVDATTQFLNYIKTKKINNPRIRNFN